MLDDSTVMVTGGAGHIGSHIVDELLKYNTKKVVIFDNFSSGRESSISKDNRVEVIRGDIRDYEDIYSATSGCDYVIHTAGTLLLECKENPLKGLNININGTYNVIKAAIECDIKKIVFSSSGSVYGDPSYLPMDEVHPYNSETVYGTTKIAGEHLLKDFYRSHGMSFVALRYFNVYGPRQHYRGAYTQVIPRWFDAIFENKPITIHGDGTQTMDMTYVTDVARANVLAVNSNLTNDFINVGTGKSYSINQLAEIMSEVAGKKLEIIYKSQDVNLVKQRQCSIEQAKKLIDFEYSVDVYEGLQKYYEWRLSNTRI